jgi:cell division protein FtsA
MQEWWKLLTKFLQKKAYGHEDPRKKLIAGIVLTGGGAQKTHKLVEYITGMDTRIGYPNEHLAGNSDEEISSPLYATAVGLVMKSIENKTHSAIRVDAVEQPKAPVYRQAVVQNPVIEKREEEDQNQMRNTTLL